MDVKNNDRALFQEHWKHTIVFTDALHIECPGENGKAVPESELFPGELSAVTFSVGCYTVRSAQRVYRIHEPGYSLEKESPADEEEVALVRKDTSSSPTVTTGFQWWRDKLRITHEISARHNDSLEGKFTYICRAAEAQNGRWKEQIGAVYSVKESEFIPDEYASLMVCIAFVGDSRSFDTWYKFDPTGKVSTLH